VSKARIYIVDDASDTKAAPRLVRAISQSQAIKHVTKPFTASVATQDQLIEALDNGVKVENAGAAEPQS
jgi:hypothetical protein